MKKCLLGPLKKYLTIICLLLGSGIVYSAPDFPSYTGFINDYTGLLAPQEKQELELVSADLKQKNGAELAVAIVKSAAPLDTKLYAVKLFEKWKIGEKGKDNGVLILLAVQEKRIEIEVGYGLEGILNDALCGQLLDEYAIPSFKQGDFGKGLIETAKAISGIVQEKEGQGRPLKGGERKGLGKRMGEKDYGLYILYIVIGVVIIGLILRKGTSIFMGIFGVFWGAAFAGLLGAFLGGVFGLIMGLSSRGGRGIGGWGGYSTFGGMGSFGEMGGGGFGGFGGGGSGGGGAGRGW